MARPYRIYERLLAETQQNTNMGNTRNRRRKRVAPRSQKENVKIEEGQEDENYTFNWPDKFLTMNALKKFAREKSVPLSALTEFIKQGRLKVFRFPDYPWDKYSTKQLGCLVRNFNKLF